MQLIEATYADAKSVTVAKVARRISHQLGTESRWSFELVAQDFDLHTRYEVMAHISRDGSDAISTGDFRNVQSYPVTPSREAVPILIQVRPV